MARILLSDEGIYMLAIGIVLVLIILTMTTIASCCEKRNSRDGDEVNSRSSYDRVVQSVDRVGGNIQQRRVDSVDDSRQDAPTTPPLMVENTINNSTRGRYAYQQVGVLYNTNPEGDSKVLPLFGRPTYAGSQKWNYYTNTDGYNPIKLSLQLGNRDCLDQVGCNEINDADTISIPELNGTFKVRIYQTIAPSYIPNVL